MTNLITLEEYKTSENIQSVKDDARLTSIITSVSQLVKTYCNNSFLDFYSATAKTEVFNINYAENFVQLTESPIVGDPVVSERENTTSAYETLVVDKDYYVDNTTDSIYRVEKNWKNGRGAVKVVYNAGYETCPEDLKLAVMDLVTYYHKDEHKARQTIAGASIQNNASTSQRNNVAFPDHIKRVLDLYKNF